MPRYVHRNQKSSRTLFNVSYKMLKNNFLAELNEIKCVKSL